MVLFNSQNSIISFALTVPGTYLFTLIVSDGKDFSSPDTVTIIVRDEDNPAPVANAEPPMAGSRISTHTVDLDGLASFNPDGDPITYLWTVTNQDTAVVTLTVSNGRASSSEVTTISVELPDNQPPLADAGADAEAALGSEVTLGGTVLLDGKRKVEGSKRKSIRTDIGTLCKQNEAIHNPLRTVLSAVFLSRLDRCTAQGTKGDEIQATILHELKLADQITASLDAMSLLVVEFTSGDLSETAVSLGQFAQLLERSNVNFNAPDSATMICTYDNPTKAFALLQEFSRQHPAGSPRVTSGVSLHRRPDHRGGWRPQPLSVPASASGAEAERPSLLLRHPG